MLKFEDLKDASMDQTLFYGLCTTLVITKNLAKDEKATQYFKDCYALCDAIFQKYSLVIPPLALDLIKKDTNSVISEQVILMQKLLELFQSFREMEDYDKE